MSEVTRYRFKAPDVEEGALVMIESRAGDYVTHTAFDALAKEMDGLKAQLALELERRFEGNRIASQETAEEVSALQAEVDRMWGYVHVARVDIRNVCVRLSMDTATDNGRDHLELCRIGKFLDAILPWVNDNPEQKENP